MNDRAPLTRLDALRVIERMQLGDLARTRRWIAAEERRDAERTRGVQARPPAPEWLIEEGLGGHKAVYAHVGDCWSGKRRTRPISRDEARRALAESIDPPRSWG